MKLLYKERCPICHHALKVDTSFTSLVYMCKVKYSHYSYTEIDYGDPLNSYVEFHVPNYRIIYKIAEDEFDIAGRDDNITHSYIITIPKLDFKWDNLQKLSDRIKTLITFS